MQRLLLSWLLLAATLLLKPFATETRRWGDVVGVSASWTAELPAVPAARSTTTHGTLDVARGPRPLSRYHAGPAGLALPAAPTATIPPVCGADYRTRPRNDSAGAWLYAFPYYPTGPPLA